MLPLFNLELAITNPATTPAISDQVCMSAVAKEMKIQKNFKVIVFSSYPEIFVNNPYVWKNIGIKKRTSTIESLQFSCTSIVLFLKTKNLLPCCSTNIFFMLNQLFFYILKY